MTLGSALAILRKHGHGAAVERFERNFPNRHRKMEQAIADRLHHLLHFYAEDFAAETVARELVDACYAVDNRAFTSVEIG